MFLPVTNTSDETIDINTALIVTLYKNQVMLSGGVVLDLTDESMKELRENVYGDGKSANPKTTVHNEALLNQLHKLCGGKNDAKPTSDRIARLKTRLKDFSVDELMTAAENLGANAFMQGENDSNKRYGTIDYLLKTSANVNKWIEETPKKKKGMF